VKSIRIVSPAKAIDKKHLDYAVGFLESKGYKVELSEFAAGSNNYFSGTDEQRLSDFQDAVNDESVDIILCSRGGYGSVRIIDSIDFGALKKLPKLIIGYSDVTVFHSVLNGLGIESAHATVPLNFEENSAEAIQSFLNVLSNAENKYEIEPHILNREGKVEAPVVGGNLAVLSSLIGTNSDISTDGKILFIEDIGEAIYAIDRMMWSLKKSGKLDKLAGIVVGGMTNMTDSEMRFGNTVEEVIRQAVDEYDYPVCFNFPAGHVDDNRALVFGRKASLDIGANQVLFRQ